MRQKTSKSLLLRFEKYLFALFVLLVLFLALCFRFYKLSEIPRGLNWDEVSYAYNAYSLKETGKDEWGVSWPPFLKAFGDYKPALLSYLQIISFWFFGLTTFAVRFPTSLLGMTSIIALGVFVFSKTKDKWLSLAMMFLLTISPWHVHYSRIAMDPIVGFSFLMIGLAFFVQKKWLFKTLGMILLLVSMYTYNAERLLLPVFSGLYLSFLFLKNFLKKKPFKTFLVKEMWVVVFFGLSAIVFAYLTFFNSAGSRAISVLAIDKVKITENVNEIYFRSSVSGLPILRILNNKLVVIGNNFAKGYLLHFSSGFLFFDDNLSPRHAFSKYGNLLLIFIPFFIAGAVKKIRRPDDFSIFMISWLLISPLAAALTTDIPHSGRTLQMVVPIVYFVAVGVFYLIQLTKVSLIKKLTITFTLSVLLFNTALYWRDYLIFFPEESGLAFQNNIKQLANFIGDSITKNPEQVVYVINAPTDPAIFLAWYLQIDPNSWQKADDSHRKIGKILIKDVENENAICYLKEPNSMIITANNIISRQIVEPNSYVYSEDRFAPPVKSFDVYITEELIMPNWLVIRERCVD
ncbi:MAG: phospholipid carrier-dependent glycosyltransferase [Patescibacteria group bacterium]